MTVEVVSSSPRNGVSSTGHPALNTQSPMHGFIERQVQTIENDLDKAEKSGKDLTMPMLYLKSTPIDTQLPSPAELLYQRKLKSNFISQN